MKTTETQEPLLHRWLRYSKRIAMIGIIQWIAIAVIALAIVGITIFLSIPLDEWATSVIKSIVTSSSTLAIATTTAYYAHSAYEKRLEQQIKSAIGLSSDDDTDEDEDDEEVQG